MTNVDDQVRSRAEAFVAGLTALVRGAALEAVRSELGGVAQAGPIAKARPIAKAAPAARAASARKATPAAKPAAKRAAALARKPGEKRDPGELTKLVELLAGYIKANPGQRMEQIIPALGVPRKDLALPIRKLLHADRITAKGEKRGTVYTSKG